MMRENRMKEMWERGEAVVNGWLHVPDPYSAEVMAHAGWDSLTVDMQHGAADFARALAMLQAISTTGVVPLVRVPWNEPGVVMRMLDAGAYGIICPMINTREDAERFVGACRYPSGEFPNGYRSYGPFRASLYGGPDYAARANETVVAMAMIETRQALENLEDILSVAGLDAVFVGPADLGQSLGEGPGLDREEPRVVEAIDAILASAKRHGVAAGIFAGSPEYAARMADKGFGFVNVSTDARLMASGAERVVSSLKNELEG